MNKLKLRECLEGLIFVLQNITALPSVNQLTEMFQSFSTEYVGIFPHYEDHNFFLTSTSFMPCNGTKKRMLTTRQLGLIFKIQQSRLIVKLDAND